MYGKFKEAQKLTQEDILGYYNVYTEIKKGKSWQTIRSC